MATQVKTDRTVLWIVIGSISFGFLALVGVAAASFLYFRSPKPTREVQSTQQKYQEAAEVFSGQPKVSATGTTDVESEIRAFFVDFGKLALGKDARLVDEFDFAMMVEAARQQGLTALAERRDVQAFVEGMKASAGRTMSQQFHALGWDDVRLQSTRFLKGQEEAVAYVRHGSANGLRTKMRWWLIRREGHWRVYDFEDLDTSLRASSMITSSVQSNKGDAWLPSVQQIQQASQHLMAEDFDAAEQALKKVSEEHLPTPLKALHHMLLATIRLAHDNPTEALKEINLAEQFNADMPVLYFQRANAHAALGQYDESLEQIAKYESLLGADADTYLLRGDLFSTLGRREDAIEAYRQGVADDPESSDNLYGLANTLGAEAGQVVAPLLAKTRDPANHFELICSGLYSEDKLEVLESLVNEYRRIAPADPNVDFYEAYLHHVAGRYERAAALLDGAIARVKDEEDREAFVEWYQRNMVLAGRSLDAYQRASNQVLAFETIGDELCERRDRYSLRALVDAHQSHHGDDPWLPYYLAQTFVFEGNYVAAGEVLEKSIPTWPDDERRGSASRDLYLQSMRKAERFLQAYEHAPDPAGTFEYFANHLSVDVDDVPELRGLIDAHAAKYPDDPWLAYYRGEAHRLVGEHEQADRIFGEAMKLPLDEEILEYYRIAWVCARFEAGQGLDAYRRIGPKSETLPQLCVLYAEQRDVAGLRQLLVAHRAAGDEPKNVQSWEAEADYLEGSYEHVVQLLTSLDKAELSTPYDTWRVADRTIRSLARLGRDAEALQCVARQPDDGFRPVWRAVIHARAGRYDTAAIVLEEALRERIWSIDNLYADEDLGTLLLLPPFETFRENYPPTTPLFD